MNGVDKVAKGCLIPWAKAHFVAGQRLESSDGRLEWQVRIAVSDDSDDFDAGKLRLGQLTAIGQRAAMLSVRRENVHKHVVIRLAVVSLYPKEFAFDEQVSSRCCELAFRPPAKGIGAPLATSCAQCITSRTNRLPSAYMTPPPRWTGPPSLTSNDLVEKYL